MKILTLPFTPPVKKVAVFMGGNSPERDVSLLSGNGVANALESAHFHVQRFDLKEPYIPEEAKECDIVFPVLHGGFGEDGTIQSLLENEKLPYVGCGPVTSRLCMDKDRFKQMVSSAGISVPYGMLIKEKMTTIDAQISLPFIIKPNYGGSSIHLHLVQTREEYLEILEHCDLDTNPMLLEEYIKGTEVTVGVVSGEALPPVEIRPPQQLYDYDAKYTYKKGKTEYFCPPKSLSDQVIHDLKRIAEKIWNVLDARDMLRIDFIVENKTMKPYVLEANTIPGFTPTSLLPKSAQALGISYQDLCVHLVLSAWSRHIQKNGIRV